MNNNKIIIKNTDIHDIQENIIYNFKDKYVQAERIYVKVTPCILVLMSTKKLVRKNSGSVFHCLAEK